MLAFSVRHRPSAVSPASRIESRVSQVTSVARRSVGAHLPDSLFRTRLRPGELFFRRTFEAAARSGQQGDRRVRVWDHLLFLVGLLLLISLGCTLLASLVFVPAAAAMDREGPAPAGGVT